MKILLTTMLLAATVSTAHGAALCFTDSPQGPNATVNCDPISPSLFPNSWIGWSAQGAPCEFGTCFGPEFYGWSISLSDTDPFANSGPIPVAQFAHLYLWMSCSLFDGAAAAQFGLVTDGDPSFFLVGLTPRNGCLNAGTTENPLLAIPGCPSGPFLAAELTVVHFGTVATESESWGGIKAMYR